MVTWVHSCQPQTMWPHLVSVRPLAVEFGIEEDYRSKMSKSAIRGRS